MTQQKTDRKCKDTKRLVRIANEHGMTNQDIAEMAGLKRTSGALVSRWRNGPTLATERQMGFFIKEFGGLLKRKIEHLFYKEISGELEFYKLQGEVLFKYSVRTHKIINKRPVKVALMKVIVLQQHNKYHLVSQLRGGLNANYPFKNSDHDNLSHSDNEDANWNIHQVNLNLSPDVLIQEIDIYALSLKNSDNPLGAPFTQSAKELRFIARQALLKQGFQSTDIIDLGAEK